MSLRVLIVQHGEKERAPGDPGLTAEGRRQADETGRWLAKRERPVAIWSSPMRRAQETAAAIALHLGIAGRSDPRLRERMNWDGGIPIEAFLVDWRRASVDRSFQSTSGDSSDQAAARFLAALEDLRAEHASGTAIVVAHGGVTTDVLRTVVGDDRLGAVAPNLVEEGMPCCAITTLRGEAGQWIVEAIADISHLATRSSTVPPRSAEPADDSRQRGSDDRDR